MVRIRSAATITTAALAASSLALIMSTPATIRAQSDTWEAPHRMLLSPERAFALVQAADRRLDYVPGEVLVRFHDGVSAAGQTRALSALRGRPSAGDLRWVGDVAVVTDRTEFDATILAA